MVRCILFGGPLYAAVSAQTRPEIVPRLPNSPGLGQRDNASQEIIRQQERERRLRRQQERALAAATPAARLGCARRAARALPAHADDRCADGACRTPFSCAAMSPRVLAAVRHVAGEGRACQSIWRRVDDGGASATGRLHGSVILSYAHRLALNALFHVSMTQNDGGDCNGMRGTAGMADSPCMPAAGLDGGRQPKI